MLRFTHPEPRCVQTGGVPNLLHLPDPQPTPNREQLRHLVIGSPDGVRSAIHSLHVLNYADQALWSRIIAVPQSGIVITPEQGAAFSYLLRYRQLD